MPYITQQDRAKYNQAMSQLTEIASKGDLEYCIFLLMKIYMSNREQKYTELHNCVYAAAHAADEFRRRYLDPREDLAILKNGDI